MAEKNLSASEHFEGEKDAIALKNFQNLNKKNVFFFNRKIMVIIEKTISSSDFREKKQ